MSITDPGTFNILAPVEFEAVCRALATLDDLGRAYRAMFAAMP